MGTSKSYKARVTGQPQWGNLSNNVTSSCTGTTVSNDKLARIMDRFVEVIGGAKNAGGGNSRIAGKGGIRSAKKLGGFLAGFAASGGNLSGSLASETGLTDLTGKSAEDVINHLIEYCSGPSSTIDDRAAKEATRQLLEEISAGAETIEELEAAMKEAVDQDSLEDFMIRYFGYYILEHLSVMFYEKLVQEKGKTECSDLFRQIRDFIRSRLAEMNKTNSLDNIDWGSSDADRIIKSIQTDVLTVFEDEN